MKSESAIQSDITKYLESNGFFVFKIQSANKRGIPDVFAKRMNAVYFFEIKTPTGKLSKLQEYSINILNTPHIIAHVVRSVDDVKIIINNQ